MARFHPFNLAAFFMLATGLPAVAQTGTVSGRVVGASGEPLQGASVTANGTARGATVRADGSYSSHFRSDDTNYALVFSATLPPSTP